jgi:penicillin-binding protein-related factor A (putative recombinase)
MKRGTTGLLPLGMAAQQSRRSTIGNVTESIVEVHNDICERAGICSLRRVPTPMRVTGHARGGVTAVFVKASTVDYLGWTLTAPSRPILVEAKHVEMTPGGVRIPFSRIEPQQRTDLSAVQRLGGVAVLLVVCRAKLYPVPWAVVQAMIDEKRPSMLCDDYLAKDGFYLRDLV